MIKFQFRLFLLLSIFALLSACAQFNPGTRGQEGKPPKITSVKITIPFKTQLEVLERHGFTLNRGVSISDIDRWGNGRKQFESPPYTLLYRTLCQTIEIEPWITLVKDKCWDFDTEAIEDHGSYIEILKNLQRISRGEINFENLKDFVDVEKGVAWVSFTFQGYDHK